MGRVQCAHCEGAVLAWRQTRFVEVAFSIVQRRMRSEKWLLSGGTSRLNRRGRRPIRTVQQTPA
jgi:hypothetical protein